MNGGRPSRMRRRERRKAGWEREKEVRNIEYRNSLVSTQYRTSPTYLKMMSRLFGAEFVRNRYFKEQ